MTLRLNGSTSGYTEIDAPASAGNNTLVLPTGNGSNGQTLMTNGAGALSFQWNAGTLFYRNEAAVNGANVNTPQSIFGVGVTLEANTAYIVEGMWVFVKTAGVTSHNFRIGFSLSTLTAHNATFVYQGVSTNTALGTIDTSLIGLTAGGTGNNDFATGIASATHTIGLHVRGTVLVDAGGIFQPTYDLSAAPGGAYNTRVGSYIALTPIGTGLGAISQGTWS